MRRYEECSNRVYNRKSVRLGVVRYCCVIKYGNKIMNGVIKLNPESEWLQTPISDGNEYDPFKEILYNDEKVLCDD